MTDVDHDRLRIALINTTSSLDDLTHEERVRVIACVAVLYDVAEEVAKRVDAAEAALRTR